MLDADYEALRVKASIAPQSIEWPKPDFSKTSITTGKKPHVDAGDLHWSTLHDCVETLRTHTLKALGTFSGIDENKSLSLEGKREAKQKAAQAALNDLEKSQVLTKARAAVEQQVKRWDEKLAPPPVDPVVATEIRAHVLRMQVGDRLPFVAKHILDAGPAVIAGPAFLSGLTPAEHEIVKKQFEMKMNPELAGAKARTVTALAQAEAGFRNASKTIRSRGGLEVGNGGMAAA